MALKKKNVTFPICVDFFEMQNTATSRVIEL